MSEQPENMLPITTSITTHDILKKWQELKHAINAADKIDHNQITGDGGGGDEEFRLLLILALDPKRPEHNTERYIIEQIDYELKTKRFNPECTFKLPLGISNLEQQARTRGLLDNKLGS